MEILKLVANSGAIGRNFCSKKRIEKMYNATHRFFFYSALSKTQTNNDRICARKNDRLSSEKQPILLNFKYLFQLKNNACRAQSSIL